MMNRTLDRDGAPAAPAMRAVPDRQADAPVVSHVVEIVEADGLARIADAWSVLAARAVEPNALMAPAFATAALTELADARGFVLAAIWRTDRDATQLIGLFAFARTRRRWGLPIGLALGLAHNYGPLGTPLLDRDHGGEAASTLLQWLRRHPVSARFALIPFLPGDGPAAALVLAAAERLGLAVARLDPFERGLAAPSGPGRYTDAALGRKKRHDLARQRRRLEELGIVAETVLAAPSELGSGIEAFLALEAAGWKGRAGTATLQRPDRAAFLRRAVVGMGAAGQARIHLLTLDGMPIAAGIAFTAGARGWFWKIAYDEAHARHSPGMQLAVALTDDLLRQPRITSIDSVADPGHPMIDHLFRERLAISDLLIDLTPGGSRLMPVILRLEGLRRAARRHARHLANNILKRRPR